MAMMHTLNNIVNNAVHGYYSRECMRTYTIRIEKRAMVVARAATVVDKATNAGIGKIASIASVMQLRTAMVIVKPEPAGQWGFEKRHGAGKWHWKAVAKREKTVQPMTIAKGR